MICVRCLYEYEECRCLEDWEDSLGARERLKMEVAMGLRERLKKERVVLPWSDTKIIEMCLEEYWSR